MYTRLTGRPKTAWQDPLSLSVFILVVLTLLWRTVRYALEFPLFGDEAFVANSFMVRDFAGLTSGLEHYQIVPLLYLWGTLLATKIAGSSEWVLRSLSYAAGVLSVLLFVRLAFRTMPLKPALMSLAIFCASYYPARHAVEVKPYSFDLLASLCITLAVVEYVKRRSRRGLAMWAVACTVGVWASYPAVFVAAGSCLVLVLYDFKANGRLDREAAAVGVLSAVSFLAMYIWVGSEQRAAGEDVLVNLELWASTFPPWSQPSRFGEWFVHTHLGKMFAYPNGGNDGGSTLTFLLFCIGIWSQWRRNRLVVLLLLSSFPLMLMAASIEAYPYGGSARVAQHVAPAICLLAGAGLSRLLRLRPGTALEKRALVVVTVCCLLIIGGIVRDVRKPYKELADEVNRRVVSELAAAAPDDESWIVFGSWGKSTEPVPDLYDWAGSAARLRYYLLREASPRLRWGPGAGRLQEMTGRPARLLVYQHPYVTFPKTDFEDYLQIIRGHFDVGEAMLYSLEEGEESLTVFELRSRGAP